MHVAVDRRADPAIDLRRRCRSAAMTSAAIAIEARYGTGASSATDLGRAPTIGRADRGRCRRRTPADRCRAGWPRPAPATASRSNARLPLASRSVSCSWRNLVFQNLASQRSDFLLFFGKREIHDSYSLRSLLLRVAAEVVASRGSGHAEADHGDDVALHLVGAAAEGEDQRAAIVRVRCGPSITAPGEPVATNASSPKHSISRRYASV